MSNPNFVSDLVAMAKAFEELPQVRAELEAKTHDHDVAQQMIQRLELRLMDLKNELDAAHANTRKVEVERDHVERMFLETDDRLNAFRRLLGSFQTEAGALIAEAEPTVEPKAEPEIKPIDEHGQVNYQPEPGPTIGDAFTLGQSDGPLSTSPEQSSGSVPVGSGITIQPEGVSVAADPTLTSTQTTELTPSSGDGTQSDKGSISDVTEAVSVQPDPTQATESSSESVSSGLGSLHDPAYGTAPDASTTFGLGREVAAPVDPTASFTAGDGHSPESATPTTDAIALDTVNTQEQPATAPSDDVGYHNEPQIKPGDGGWLEWDRWCERMNLRYPRELGGWPPRNAPATA